MKMKTTLTMLLILELYGLSSCLIKQHFYVNVEKDWRGALQHCKKFYQGMSTFTDVSEAQQFLLNTVGQNSDAWVGLYKRYGVWKWTGGEYATYMNWDPLNQQAYDENCVFIHHSTKQLRNEKCYKKRSFFCMTKDFELVLQNESWEGALEYCRNRNNDLASLSSMDRMTSASGKVTQAQTEFVWTGLRFLAGEWLWVSGNDLDYTAWSQSGQSQCPATNLRCGALDKQTRLWTPRDCEEKLNFFCSVHTIDTSLGQTASPTLMETNN